MVHHDPDDDWSLVVAVIERDCTWCETYCFTKVCNVST